MQIANPATLLVVKFKAMCKVSAGKNGRNQACLTQQVVKRVCIGINARLSQVAAVLGKDEVRTVFHAHGVSTHGDAQTSLA